MEKILGFDISSTTIGYCILEVDNQKISHIKSETFKPPKKGTIFERLDKVAIWAKNIILTNKPDNIVIEDIAKYMPGKSTANTIIMLALFNRTIGMEAYHYLKKSPILYNVLSIRHGIKLSKQLPSKEDIPSIIEKHLNIKFDFAKSKQGKIKQENFDRADAIAVTLHHCLKEIKK